MGVLGGVCFAGGDADGMEMRAMIDADPAYKPLIEPETVYERPLDIVDDQNLSHENKLTALQKWDETLQSRLRSVGEGMEPPATEAGDEAATVEEIAEARRRLGAVTQNDVSTTTVAGVAAPPPAPTPLISR